MANPTTGMPADFAQQREIYKAKLAASESGGRYDTVNSLGYTGKYQFGKAVLIDLGVYEKDGTGSNKLWLPQNFTGAYGIRSQQDLLSNPKVQEQLQDQLINRQIASARRMGLLDHVGAVRQTPQGPVTLTFWGIVAGMHLHPAQTRDFVLHGKLGTGDANGTQVASYIAKMGDGSPAPDLSILGTTLAAIDRQFKARLSPPMKYVFLAVADRDSLASVSAEAGVPISDILAASPHLRDFPENQLLPAGTLIRVPWEGTINPDGTRKGVDPVTGLDQDVLDAYAPDGYLGGTGAEGAGGPGAAAGNAGGLSPVAAGYGLGNVPAASDSGGAAGGGPAAGGASPGGPGSPGGGAAGGPAAGEISPGGPSSPGGGGATGGPAASGASSGSPGGLGGFVATGNPSSSGGPAGAAAGAPGSEGIATATGLGGSGLGGASARPDTGICLTGVESSCNGPGSRPGRITDSTTASAGLLGLMMQFQKTLLTLMMQYLRFMNGVICDTLEGGVAGPAQAAPLAPVDPAPPPRASLSRWEVVEAVLAYQLQHAPEGAAGQPPLPWQVGRQPATTLAGGERQPLWHGADRMPPARQGDLG